MTLPIWPPKLRSALAPSALTVTLPGPWMTSLLLRLSIVPLLVSTMSPDAPVALTPPPPLPMLRVAGAALPLLIKIPPVLVSALSVLVWVCSGAAAVPMPVEADRTRVGAVTSTSAPLSPSRIAPLVLVRVVVPAEERPDAKVRLPPVEIVVVLPAFDDCAMPSTAPMVSALALELVKLTAPPALAKASVSMELPLFSQSDAIAGGERQIGDRHRRALLMLPPVASDSVL